MRLFIKYITTIAVLFSGSSCLAQVISVRFAEDKNPVIDAHIVCKNIETQEQELVLTDQNGNANIGAFFNENPATEITISYLGFKKIKDTIYSMLDKIYYLQPKNAELSQFVVTAQYAPNNPEKAVHKIRIIDAEKINSMAAQNLQDVLSNELNVRLSQDQMLGSSISMQGISGQNIKILIDGIPVIGRLNGNIDVSQINMNNVARIEIIEGPLSVNYGTDALGGTINVITKKNQKKTFSVASNNYYESNGRYNTSGKIGYQKNKTSISISGGRNYFDGWRTIDDPFQLERSRIADDSRHMEWKPKEQYFAGINYGHYFKDLKLSYNADYFYEQVTNRGLPRLPYFETAFDDYYNTRRITNSLNLSGKLSANYNINILAAQNNFKRVKNTFYKNLTNLKQSLTENPGEQDTALFNNYMMRGSISRSKENSKINFELGYDINYEVSRGLRIKNNKQHIGDYAIFSSAEYKPVGNLIIRPGIRFIYNSSYKAPLVPSLNFKFNLPQMANTTAAIRGSYARGFRSPSLKELYFYFVDINHNIEGNENLKAEQSHNFNLSTILKNNFWKLEASFFYNYIENMISLAQETGTQYSYFNLDEFKTIGFQMKNTYTFQKLKIAVAAAYIGRQNQILSKINSKEFAYTPEGQINIIYEWQEGISCAIFYKYTGKLPGFGITDDSTIYKTEINDYHSADASVSKKFLNERINLSLGAKNIFDVTNIKGISEGNAHANGSSNIAVGTGRTYFVKLGINLNSKN